MPANPSADEVGSNIRAEMGRRRVNMSELARRTKIPRGTLWGQINGGTVTVENLLLIAGALGVEACALLSIPAEVAS